MREPIPRVILIIDEVHQLFSGSWKMSGEFEKVLDHVVRQGRGFGIHLVLSTQTLTGANVSASIMSQIPLRIAFKLAGTETFKIFPSNNDAPVKLKPYQFVYNAEAGIPAANRIANSNPPENIPKSLDNLVQSYPFNIRLHAKVIDGSHGQEKFTSPVAEVQTLQVEKPRLVDSNFGKLKL